MYHHFKQTIIAIILSVTLLGVSPIHAEDTPPVAPNYKFSGVKAPESPYKNTWSAFQTNLFSGSFSYQYNIIVPPGTNGLQPKITLSHNSHSARGKSGWAGSGWEIPLNYIQRDIEYTRKDTSDDTFDLCLNGAKHDLVLISPYWHTKIESFLKIERFSGASNEHGEYWLISTKDGMKYRFGHNADSEHLVSTSDTSFTRYVWRWSLDQIEDTNGNHIFLTYEENPANGEVYLKKIEYNNDKKRVVDFVYASRSDSYKVIEQGSEILETKILKEIRVLLDGSLVRKYVLNHTLNEAENKSLLKSVVQYGKDGTSALPAITFDYHSPQKQFNPVTSWPTPGNQWIRKNDEKSNQVVGTYDVTGDGRPDFVKSHKEDTVHWEIYRNLKTGFAGTGQNETWPTYFKHIRDIHTSDPDEGASTRCAPMDFNRDGFVDIAHVSDSNILEIKFNNNGSGFSPDISRWSLPIGNAWIRRVQEPGDDMDDPPNVEQEFTDINGDGHPDLVVREDENHWHIWRNRGACINNPADPNCFVDYGVWRVEHSDGFLEEVEDDNDVRVMMSDMNGDGLIDIIAGNNTNDRWYVHLNTGSKFLSAADWTPPGLGDEDIIEIDKQSNPAKSTNTKRTLTDINGDGLPDIVNAEEGNYWKVWFNNGDGFTTVKNWNKSHFPYSTDDVRDNTYDGDDIEKESRVRRDLMDMNGDGLPDIVNRTDQSHWNVYHNAHAYPDHLTKITDMLGGTVEISYTSSMNYDHTKLPFNYWLVTSVTTNNRMEGDHTNISTRSYSYNGGFYDYPTREFRGFATVTETLPDSSKAIHVFHQDEGRKGKEDKYDIKDAGNAPYAAADNTWDSSLANGVYKILITRIEQHTYGGVSGNPKIARTEYKNYDKYGNVGLLADYGDVSTASDDLYTYKEYYRPCAGDNRVTDKLKRMYVKSDPDGPILREFQFVYDNYPNCLYRGNLTSEELWLDGGENPVITHRYDNFGNRIMTVDPEGRITRTEYDAAFHTFPVKVYNPKKHLITRSYDPASGSLLEETDPNGYTTRFVYDVFHRKTKKIRPYDTEDFPTALIQYFIDGALPKYVMTSKRENSVTSETLDRYQYIDGMGNPVQTKTEYETPGQWIASDVFYDKMGRVSAQSNPYLSNTSAYQFPSLDTKPSIRYEYDILSRPIRILNPDGTQIQRVFDHWTVTEWDENSHFKSYKFDARQRLLSVTENNMGAQYHTLYEYLPTGELERIIDHPANVTTITYDTLGRKTRMDDPDMGVWHYAYDLAGNLVEQTDARGITVSIRYDALNRKTLVDYPSDADIIYTYDTVTIGTLSQIADASGHVSYEYDQRLRKIREERKIDDYVFPTHWSYDAMDRVVSQTYPDGEIINYEYNPQGILESVSGILSSLSYNASGQIVRKTYTNGISTDYDYDPLNLRLTRIHADGIQNFQYAYDNVGNILSITDGIDGLTENFTYDDLDRLISAGDAEYSAAYSYNAIGNMLNETFNGNATEYSYGDEAGPHAVTGKTTPLPVVGTFTLANGSLYATLPEVTLNNVSFGDPTHYMASEDKNFTGATWEAYAQSPAFSLSSGYGLKTVYFKIKNADGESEVKSDTIEYLHDTDMDTIPDKYDDDDDDDGIPDTWETEHGLDPLDDTDAQADNDGDRLDNLDEYIHGTDLERGDTDNDGWNDYDEVYIYDTAPTKMDTDGDGYMDAEDPKVNTPNHYPESDNNAVTRGQFHEGGGERTSGTYVLQDRIGRLFSGSLVMNEETWDVLEVIGDSGGTLPMPDDSAIITFPPSALPDDSTVKITKLESPDAPSPNGGFVLIGNAYEFIVKNDQDENITDFDEPVEITLKYYPGSLGLVSELDLAIHYYDDVSQQWIALPSVVNTENHTVTATTYHFTEFAIMAPKPVNHEPEIISAPPSRAYIDEEYVYHIAATDDDGDGLSYVLIQNPPGMTTDSESGKISWVPDPSQTGVHFVEIHVSDGHSVVRQLFYIMVTPVGDVTLGDVVRCLQILVGTDDDAVYNGDDLTQDRKIGLEDVIYMLNIIAGIREGA